MSLVFASGGSARKRRLGGIRLAVPAFAFLACLLPAPGQAFPEGEWVSSQIEGIWLEETGRCVEVGVITRAYSIRSRGTGGRSEISGTYASRAVRRSTVADDSCKLGGGKAKSPLAFALRSWSLSGRESRPNQVPIKASYEDCRGDLCSIVAFKDDFTTSLEIDSAGRLIDGGDSELSRTMFSTRAAAEQEMRRSVAEVGELWTELAEKDPEWFVRTRFSALSEGTAVDEEKRIAWIRRVRPVLSKVQQRSLIDGHVAGMMGEDPKNATKGRFLLMTREVRLKDGRRGLETSVASHEDGSWKVVHFDLR